MTICQLHWDTTDDEEIRLRVRPLREHWEARGPGLLGRLRTLLPWLDIPNKVTVHLIPPKVGGAGRVIARGEVEFEAVLANTWPMLPEVVRLAWLIACSALETNESVDEKASLALIPPIIEAAEYVELARLDQTAIDCAVNHWGEFGIDAVHVMRWWQESEHARRNEEEWRNAIGQL